MKSKFLIFPALAASVFGLQACASNHAVEGAAVGAAVGAGVGAVTNANVGSVNFTGTATAAAVLKADYLFQDTRASALQDARLPAARWEQHKARATKRPDKKRPPKS